jgi:hypothetical protein
MRTLVWFSCGVTSACVAKLVSKSYLNVEVLYCDTLAYEHPDNKRFMHDVSEWIGQEIKIIRSEKYTDIYDVFNKTGWLVGNGMAKCTQELKIKVREQYMKPEDIHIFGFTVEEAKRIERFKQNNPDLYCIFPLQYLNMNKQDCFNMLIKAGIEIPMMYKLGYKNNNCIGCVKGGKGYWNKIRVDFPDSFERMAKQERKMGVKIFKDVYLDELPKDAGRYKSEYEIECGIGCGLYYGDNR